jgi:hypothetical protein
LDYTANKNIIHKRRLYTFTKNSNDPKTKTHYIKYCRILQNVIQEAKKLHYGRLIAKSNNKIKTTWNIIKKGTGKEHPVEEAPSLLVNNEKLTDPTMVANAFNNFFLTVTEKLNTQKPEKGDAISFLKNSFPRNFTSIKIIPITATEIKSNIRSLKPRNSSGYDEITSKILKTCASTISLPLSFICNHSLHAGIFPDRLTIAVVKPLHKKRDKYNTTNYRPVSLLRIFSKVFEKEWRIAMAKAAFNKKKNIFTSKLNFNLRKKLVKCYIWSMASYGAETWRLRAVDQKQLESFEMWCWRRIEKIKIGRAHV